MLLAPGSLASLSSCLASPLPVSHAVPVSLAFSGSQHLGISASRHLGISASPLFIIQSSIQIIRVYALAPGSLANLSSCLASSLPVSHLVPVSLAFSGSQHLTIPAHSHHCSFSSFNPFQTDFISAPPSHRGTRDQRWLLILPGILAAGGARGARCCLRTATATATAFGIIAKDAVGDT
jgi:hypothetical protein